MTYFEDLSGYDFSEVEVLSVDSGYRSFHPSYDRLAVGWLDGKHAFATGPVPPVFLDALFDIVCGPLVNVTRGVHRCPFCRASDTAVCVEREGRIAWLGHAEIRVPAGPSAMFAAPTLIWHYVDAHGYQPPVPFVRAVEDYEAPWTAGSIERWVPADAELDRF